MLLNLAFKQASCASTKLKQNSISLSVRSLFTSKKSPLERTNNLSTFSINPNRHYSSLRIFSTQNGSNNKKFLLVLGNTIRKTSLNSRAMSTTPVNLKLVQAFDNIAKSTQDKREYRGLLLDNGLKCLIVSDPLTDRSAASVDVHAGYMLDPKEFPGLAHFCEHMLFMGSKKVKFLFTF